VIDREIEDGRTDILIANAALHYTLSGQKADTIKNKEPIDENK